MTAYAGCARIKALKEVNHMGYNITISKDQMQTLEWLADRGYDARFLDLSQCDNVNENGNCSFYLSEVDAWEWKEEIEADIDAFLTCCGDDNLIEKLHSLMNRIV